MKSILLPGLLAAATLGLSGCAMYDGFGGASIGYDDGYNDDGYYDNGYSGDPYYDSYGDGYYGWYDGFYYPGTGYYVYDRGGSRHRWSDRHRGYWESRRGREERRENWSSYRPDRWDRDGDRRDGPDRPRQWRRDRQGNVTAPGLEQGSRILGARPSEVEDAVRRSAPVRRNWGGGAQRPPAPGAAAAGVTRSRPASPMGTAAAPPRPQSRADAPERAAPPPRQRAAPAERATPRSSPTREE